MSLWSQLHHRVRATFGRTPPFQIPKADLRKYLPTTPTIVEAGAHNGQDTVELARTWPNGHVHAFEPVPCLFAVLCERTCALPNVTCHQGALAAVTGRQRLHLSGGASDGSSSLLEPALHREFHPDVTFDEDIEVDAVTLDDWATTNAIHRVDLLWLDLQGLEPAILRASPRLLGSVRAIHTEVSLARVYAGTELYPEFRAWLETQGFRVAREFLPYPDMGNVLFVRSP